MSWELTWRFGIQKSWALGAILQGSICLKSIANIFASNICLTTETDKTDKISAATVSYRMLYAKFYRRVLLCSWTLKMAKYIVLFERNHIFACIRYLHFQIYGWPWNIYFLHLSIQYFLSISLISQTHLSAREKMHQHHW